MTHQRTGTERLAGFAIVVVALAASLLVPLVSSQDAEAMTAVPMQAPSAAHLFGTDTLGRDVLVRVFAALRLDIGLAVGAVLACTLIGTVVGVLIGLCAPLLRETLLRLVDAILAIPYMILVLGIVAISADHRIVPFVPPSVGAILLALSVTGWASYARLAAVQTQVIRQRDSVVAVRLLGFGPLRILRRHILPEVLSPSVSLAASHAVLSVAVIASLAFLGAGVQPPAPELGAIMQDGTGVLPVAWWIAVFPGLAVLALALGFMLIADSYEGDR